MTTVRLLLSVPLVQAILAEDARLAVACALAALIMDADGTVARALGATSRFGSLFDPIVDAVFIVSGFAALLVTGHLAWWPVALLVAAAIFKAIPQYRYLHRVGSVKSILWSKAVGVIGFLSVLLGAAHAPLALTSSLLIIGAAMYTMIGVLWLRDEAQARTNK